MAKLFDKIRFITKFVDTITSLRKISQRIDITSTAFIFIACRYSRAMQSVRLSIRRSLSQSDMRWYCH